MRNSETRGDKSRAAQEAPPAVLKRLPVYYRYLRSLINEDILRINSNELAERMHITASQIRSDLNYFGGFGQQGYGYNVKYLFKNISDILGATKSYRAVMITSGKIVGKDISLSVFSERGIVFGAFFATDAEESGTSDGTDRLGENEKTEAARPESEDSSEIASFSHGETVVTFPLSMLDGYCAKNDVDIIVIHSVGNEPKAVTNALCKAKCRGIWNISGYDVVSERCDIPVRNLYISDSLLSLCHSIKTEKAKAKLEGQKPGTAEAGKSGKEAAEKVTTEADAAETNTAETNTTETNTTETNTAETNTAETNTAETNTTETNTTETTRPKRTHRKRPPDGKPNEN